MSSILQNTGDAPFTPGERERAKFFALWNLQGRLTPRKLQQIHAPHERLTTALVEVPITKAQRARGVTCAFWIYCQGYEATAYIAEQATIPRLEHMSVLAPYFAPDSSQELLALTARRMLYGLDGRYKAQQAEYQLCLEAQSSGDRMIVLPTTPEIMQRPMVPHPYTITTKLWQVSLGEKSVRVKELHYTSPARAGTEGAIDHWCYLPETEQRVDIYSQPGRAELRTDESYPLSSETTVCFEGDGWVALTRNANGKVFRLTETESNALYALMQQRERENML